jgi:hypothetical protein
MKTTLVVKDKKEATAIQRAMSDPAVRAFTVVMGVLLELPTDRARIRVLQHTQEIFEDQAAGVPLAPAPLRLHDGTTGD